MPWTPLAGERNGNRADVPTFRARMAPKRKTGGSRHPSVPGAQYIRAITLTALLSQEKMTEL
jgi:hypothetical protein